MDDRQGIPFPGGVMMGGIMAENGMEGPVINQILSQVVSSLVYRSVIWRIDYPFSAAASR
jgi:hypothetical protein